jgi:2-polyprenyl-3-methyl-5-hydroxy-6-metoxy-1,4-benzoquinol methylase
MELETEDSLAFMQEVLPPPPAAILEVGCGEGALAARLQAAGYRMVAVDPDCESVATARGRGLEVVEATIQKADLAGPFDVVTFPSPVFRSSSSRRRTSAMRCGRSRSTRWTTC